MTRRVAAILLAASATLAGGCETYRVEYHKRPDYFYKAAEGGLSDRVVLDDGTVIHYQPKSKANSLWGKDDKPAGTGEDGKALKPFQVYEEDEEGNVTINAFLPEHVVAATLMCLRNERYDALWEQLVSERTKLTYTQNDAGYPQFERFCAKYRRDLLETLTRTMSGLLYQDVVTENLAQGVIRLRMRAHVGQGFKFKVIDCVGEAGGMKLLVIR